MKEKLTIEGLLHSESFTAYLNTRNKVNTIEDKIKRLEKRKDKIYNSKAYSWVNAILHPLAKSIVEKMGFKHWSIMGPFGLSCETSLWFWNEQEEYDNCKVKSLTVRPDLYEDSYFGFVVVNQASDTKEFANGTLAAINGFNKTCEEPPQDATLDWFIERLSK